MLFDCLWNFIDKISTHSIIYYIFSSNNLDDVRDQWERIKLAYEILSDKRTRKRYDRHEFISDPGAAAQRAAWNAVGNGVKGVGAGVFSLGKGLFDLGAKAVTDNMNKEAEKQTDEQ